MWHIWQKKLFWKIKQTLVHIYITVYLTLYTFYFTIWFSFVLLFSLTSQRHFIIGITIPLKHWSKCAFTFLFCCRCWFYVLCVFVNPRYPSYFSVKVSRPTVYFISLCGDAYAPACSNYTHLSCVWAGCHPSHFWRFITPLQCTLNLLPDLPQRCTAWKVITNVFIKLNLSIKINCKVIIKLLTSFRLPTGDDKHTSVCIFVNISTLYMCCSDSILSLISALLFARTCPALGFVYYIKASDDKLARTHFISHIANEDFMPLPF